MNTRILSAAATPGGQFFRRRQKPKLNKYNRINIVFW